MKKDMLAETGLKFFGTVNASISHEIKNRMAVINEQAGLLKDLVNLAEKGRDISLERLMRLAESLKTQVSLTDNIIRNMNRFAHSVDSFRVSTDISDLLSLTCTLAKRTADNRGIRIELELPNSPFSLETAPFFLMNLVWHCLEAVMALGNEKRRVIVGCKKSKNGGEIWFSTGGGGISAEGILPATALQLADTVQAVVDTNSGKKTIKIELTDRITSQ